MPAPFYNAIKGTTSGTPGTGAFTPNAASTGFRAWSTVPSGWIGMVRFEDGAAWEVSFCYWNGTTLSRGTNQRFDSSSGSLLSLTSAATASLVPDANELQSHLGGVPWRGYFFTPGTSGQQSQLMPSVQSVGTAAAASLATTNYLTEQSRGQYTSATTSGACAGIGTAVGIAVNSTSAGRGGMECVMRFGASALPTGPRLFAGMTNGNIIGNAGDPSGFNNDMLLFMKDSADTNIQFFTKTAGGSSTKTDTGISLAANGWYEASVWIEPGGGRAYGLLIRLDTGAIWFGSVTTTLPANGSLMFPQVYGALGTTTGTAIVFHVGSIFVRSGS